VSVSGAGSQGTGRDFTPLQAKVIEKWRLRPQDSAISTAPHNEQAEPD
jgi:hypothetical protein